MRWRSSQSVDRAGGWAVLAKGGLTSVLFRSTREDAREDGGVDVAAGEDDADAFPGDCLVIEDSPAGIEAGRAAGMTVWAVATTHHPDELAAADEIFVCGLLALASSRERRC